ncbi:MAG: carbohydrate kinase family protein [Thermoguttaceae bacterium]
MAEVGCAGILVADTFCGPMKRLPAEGELLALQQMPSKAGGCAANVAIDLAKQGVAADVCGCVGADASAEVLLQSMRAAGVGCQQVRRLDSHPTSKTVILLVEGQDRRYIHVFGANAAFEVRHIPRDWLDGLKVFYLGGLLAMPAIAADQLAELLAYCRGRGIVTVVDVVVAQDHAGMAELQPLWPYIDYFLPNDDEAQRLTGLADPRRQADAFLRLGVGTVVITRGPDGALAADGNDCWQAEACRFESVDPSGAGDAFAAGIVCGILRRWEMPRILRYAAVLGGSATTAVGTTDGVFDAAAAQAFLDEHPLNVTHGKMRA